ncbi:glycoside hydrolase [Schizophyllum amplum]|uniref:Alpha-galactosidase n=1 Tax=Schizophyllum amplum TaxID=97359 RepID=A0A550CNA8_9AGAR|nr:glycoside hydrolase [Auriculariopsis ampla]
MGLPVRSFFGAVYKRARRFISAAFLLFTQTHALDNGVAHLPVLGYNTWNAYQAAGYNYVNIDDCYSSHNRSDEGYIVENPDTFSRGMKNLTDTLHGLGFQTGIYSDSGWLTCGGYPGSYGNEERDAQTFFVDWGFDYLKYDNCYIPFDSITRTGIIGRYQRMADAIANLTADTNKPVVLSLCEWGWSQVWLWGKRFGQSWRTTGDIAPEWNSLAAIINTNSFITQATDFYGRNDLDMLQLGNGNLTYEESKSHFTAWALMKSPLLIGTDLSTITNETLEILTNSEILAINQDAEVGESISPFRWGINPDFVSNSTHPAQYWSGPTFNGTVFMLLNTLNEPATLLFNLTESPWIVAGHQYSVRDLWAHTDNGVAVRNITQDDVPAHGVVALLLQDAGDEPDDIYPPCSVWDQCADQDGTRIDLM